MVWKNVFFNDPQWTPIIQEWSPSGTHFMGFTPLENWKKKMPHSGGDEEFEYKRLFEIALLNSS